jgi:transposase-like protein
MNAEELFTYRSAVKALEIVDRALASGMKVKEVAVELDVDESTIRTWRANKGSAVNAATARKLRRLERRLGK